MAALPATFNRQELMMECPTEEEAFTFARQHGLLCCPETAQLNQGNGPTCLMGEPGCPGIAYLTLWDNKYFIYCPACRTKRVARSPVVHGVLMAQQNVQPMDKQPLSRFRGPISMALVLVYYWSEGMVASVAAKEASTVDCIVSERTVQEFFDHLNTIVLEKFNAAPQMVAAHGSTIQIDEARFMGKCKAHRGRPLQLDLAPGARRRNYDGVVDGPWVFGMVTRDPNNKLDLRMFHVERRDAITLRPIVLRHVSPGSSVQSDEWGAYLDLTNWGGPQNYVHHTVNHEANFVDPMSGANTQMIEGQWRHAKQALMRVRNGVKSNLQKHLAHVWFVKKYEDVAFTAALEMIAEFRPCE